MKCPSVVKLSELVAVTTLQGAVCFQAAGGGIISTSTNNNGLRKYVLSFLLGHG